MCSFFFISRYVLYLLISFVRLLCIYIIFCFVFYFSSVFMDLGFIPFYQFGGVFYQLISDTIVVCVCVIFFFRLKMVFREISVKGIILFNMIIYVKISIGIFPAGAIFIKLKKKNMKTLSFDSCCVETTLFV